MRGKRCYLCGGKLVNGRCVECGLDNEKNTKKVYHLNESVKMQDSQPRDAVQKIGKGLAIGSVILLVAAVGAVALNSYFEEQEKGQSQSGEEYDEYQLQRDSFLRQAKHTMKFLPEDIMRLAFIFQREFIQ